MGVDKSAPGRLDVLRSFLNTADFGGPPDVAADDARVSAFLRENSLSSAIDEEGLARLRAFRELLRGVLEAQAGHGDQQAAWQALEPFVTQSSFTMRPGVAGRPVLAAQGAGAAGVIARMLGIVYDAVASGTFMRMKACGKNSCRWAFYDRSKNGSGVWCDMSGCGNRVKAQRRRSRQKTARNFA